MIDENLTQTQEEPAKPDAGASLLEETGPPQTNVPSGSGDSAAITEPDMENIAGLQQASVVPPPLETERLEESEINKIRSKEFEQLMPGPRAASTQSIDILMDVTLPISIELGRTCMSIEDVLNLGPGSIVELDKLAGEPVDMLINDKLIARGEVVVVDENFGIRITSMVSQQERIKSLKS
jgi:flagellar motor switch protein FliN/FliY